MKITDVNKYIKKKALNRPENIIKGVDPVAVTLVKEMYSNLKDRGNNVVLYEKAWLNQIEKIYKDKETFDSYFLHGLEVLLKDAHSLLTSKSKTWSIKEDELLALTEKILFLKIREDTNKKFFEELEASIFSALQLDFSKKVNLISVGSSKSNIYTYKAVLINTLLEGLENSVVSAKSVNTLLDHISNAIVLVTDKQSNIRYINNVGKQLLGSVAQIKFPLSKAILNYDSLQSLIENSQTLNNLPFQVKLNNEDQLTLSTLITIRECKSSAILDELIYIIQVVTPTDKPREIDIKRQLHDKIAPITTLLAGLEVLSDKLIDKQSVELITKLKRTAERLKESTRDELKTIFNLSIKEEAEIIDINEIVNSVIEDVELGAKTKVELIKEIQKVNIISSRKAIYSILQNLLSNAIKFGKQSKTNQIKIRIFERKDAVVLQVSDTGIGIKKQSLATIFKGLKLNEKHQGNATGLMLVKRQVEELKGNIEVESIYSTGTKFTVTLPK